MLSEEVGLLPVGLTEGQRLCHPAALMADGGSSVMSPWDSHLVPTVPSQPQSLLQVRGRVQPQDIPVPKMSSALPDHSLSLQTSQFGHGAAVGTSGPPLGKVTSPHWWHQQTMALSLPNVSCAECAWHLQGHWGAQGTLKAWICLLLRLVFHPGQVKVPQECSRSRRAAQAQLSALHQGTSGKLISHSIA